MPAWSDSWRWGSSHPGSQAAAFLLGLRSGGGRREGEERARGERFLESLLIRTLILLGQGPTLRTSFNISQAPKRSISKYSHIAGQGFNVNLGGGHDSAHGTLGVLLSSWWLVSPSPLSLRPKDLSFSAGSAPLFEGKSALKETRSQWEGLPEASVWWHSSRR